MPPDGTDHHCPECGISINSSKLNGFCKDHQEKCYRHNPAWVKMIDEECEACKKSNLEGGNRVKKAKKKQDKKDDKKNEKNDPWYKQTNGRKDGGERQK
jgi:hypothetical protein